MGLDVYLKKCANRAEADRLEAEYEAKSSLLWDAEGEYKTISQERKDAIHAELKAFAEKLGLDEWGASNERECIEIDSAIDPEHYFKVGYFRSSYNGSGFDSVMRKLGLPCLDDIMGATGDEYNVVLDWDASLVRVNEAIAKYQEHLSGPTGKYAVMSVRPMWEFGVEDEKAALDMFAKHLAQDRSEDFRSFNNRDGEFHMGGIKVVAFITKQFVPDNSGNPIARLINRPEVFVVYEQPSDNKEDWYLTALKIVRETIEYVVAQPNREHFYMSWSS